MKVLHSICQQIWKAWQWPQDWKMSVFIPIPKKGNARECSNYYTFTLISHAGKVMPQNPSNQASAVHELRTSRCRNWIQKRWDKQRSNCQHPLDHRKSKRIPEKIYFCFIDYAKAFDCVDHHKLWKILKEMEMNTRAPDLPPEKSVCRSRSKSFNFTWNK